MIRFRPGPPGAALALAAAALFAGGCGPGPANPRKAEAAPAAPGGPQASTPVASVPGPRADNHLTAGQLAAAFLADKDRAEAEYAGKVLTVEGVVQDAAPDPDGAAATLLRGKDRDPDKATGFGCHVHCRYAPDSAGDGAALTKGQAVKVRGRCENFTGLFVNLTDCRVVDRENDPAVSVGAAQLAKDYLADEPAADARYAGKQVAVSGTVAEVRDDKDSATVFLDGAADKGGKPLRVSAKCPAGARPAALKLARGQAARVKGECYRKGPEAVEVVNAVVVP
jgi:hypothetical protein